MRDLLRHRDFRLLFIAQTLSMAGDWALLLVFGIWAKTLTGSSAVAGMTIFAMAAPAVLTPLGAVVVDRVSRRGLIAVVSTASAATVLCLWFVRGPDQLWLLFAVAAYDGLIGVIINAAVSALVQDMLPIELVGTANGMLTTVRQGLRLVGPLIGAGVFAAVGGGWVATIDAVSFLGAAVAVSAIRFAETARPVVVSSLRLEVVAGIAHIRADSVLRRSLLATIISLGTIGLCEPAVFALVDAGLHKPPPFVGVLSTAQGIGAVVTGTIVTIMISRKRSEAVLLVGLVGITIGIAVEPMPWLYTALLGFLIVGAALPVISVALATLLQQRTPNAVMGRVAVAFDMASSVPYTVTIGIGAVLVSVLPFRLLFALSACGCAIATLLVIPLVRNQPDRVTAPCETAQPAEASSSVS